MPDNSIFQLAIGPLIGSFFGIFLGLVLNRYKTYNDNNKTRSFYTKIIREDIDNGIKILVNNPMYFLPESTLHFVINNSSSYSFAPEELYELSNLLFEIHSYNFELRQLKDAIFAEKNELGKALGKGDIEKLHNNVYLNYLYLREDENHKCILRNMQKLKYRTWLKEDARLSFIGTLRKDFS